MKKIFLAILAASLSTICFAQNQQIAPVGLIEKDGTPILSQPQTTLYITLVVEKESIIAGPYARYAMKYLGVSAPLTDKTSYNITSCQIADQKNCSDENISQVTTIESHIASAEKFTPLPIDKLSSAQLTAEQRAADAAARIFSLRKSRMELITGEAGENVFGEGLAAALQKIDDMEQEYLSLFLGKRTHRFQTEYFTVIPQKEKQTYIICRFDMQNGLLSDTDLSGSPVLLDITASKVSTEGINTNAKPGPKDRLYRIASNCQCSVSYKEAVLANSVIPIFQMGETIAVIQK